MNGNRRNKFIKMTSEEFNTCVGFALHNGDSRVSLLLKWWYDNTTLKDAHQRCKKLYEKDYKGSLCIKDYVGDCVLLYEHHSVLLDLGYTTEKECSKYIDNYIDSLTSDD
ncbi:hypothetical protein LN736_08830 [Clostridium sp. WLY-B-L2]|uniref:Uncharacterized protein n=1 Tax=Clostridium aromativorans TaxID=2836848 RepID=A0ABS8N570_9CLOT|nr:hypothetical protein [Clostridium aromativorans]MCC9294958.1 hypothetical protein [Clostridium aromativorans]